MAVSQSSACRPACQCCCCWTLLQESIGGKTRFIHLYKATRSAAAAQYIRSGVQFVGQLLSVMCYLCCAICAHLAVCWGIVSCRQHGYSRRVTNGVLKAPSMVEDLSRCDSRERHQRCWAVQI